MGGKTSQAQSTVSIPPEVMARYNAVNARAEDVAKQPFQPYQGQFVAGITAPQQAGIAQTGQYAQAAQPYFQEGAAYTRAGSGDVGKLTPQQIQEYQNPYTKSVADTTFQALRQQQQQEMAGQTANAIRSGAFGGDRSGLAAATLARQQTLGTAQAMAPIYSQGYQQAVQTAQGQQAVQAADFARKLQAGQQIAGLGAGAQQAGLQGAQAQIGAGTVEQQTQQADLTARYQQFLQERGYPFQVAQFLANIAMGTGALSGSTTTTTQPSSFFSDRELKHDVKEIGQTNDGLPIYSFKYNGDNRTQIGLMAQDVEKKHPEAVGLAAGYKTVDYKKATEGAERDEKAYGGGLVPNSMGGAVLEPGHYAGGGSIVDGDDLNAILAAQRQMFAPFGQAGLYGGQGGTTPGQKGGYVPAASLPVAKLVTAQPPSQRSGQTGLGEIMSGIDRTHDIGEKLLGEKGVFGEKGIVRRGIAAAQEAGKSPTARSASSVSSTENANKGVAPKDGSTPKTDATNTPNQKVSSLEDTDSDETLTRLLGRDTMAAKNGGVIGRSHKMWGGQTLANAGVPENRVVDFTNDATWAMALGRGLPNPKDYQEGASGGGMTTNPASMLTSKIPTIKAKDGGAIGRIGYAGLGKVIDPMELQDPSKGINAYIEDAAEEQEDTGDDKIMGAGSGAGGGGGGKGKSGASTALGIAGTLANFIPGVGPAVGAGLKAASMLFNEGGVVPREAYQQGGGKSQPEMSDEEYAIRTAAAETSGKDPRETLGIAQVIYNRLQSGKYGKTYKDVVLAPNQFEPWSTTKNNPMNIKPNDPRYIQSREAFDRIKAGDVDPEFANVHNFWAPKAQAALGREPPLFGRVGGLDVGGTRFHTLDEVEQSRGAPKGVAGAQARAQTGDTSDVQASFQRKGAAPEGEEKGLAMRVLPTRKDAEGKEELDWRKILIPTLTGLGAMASSPSRYLGSAVLQGLGAGAQSFANLEQKMEETKRTAAETGAIETDTYQKSFQTTPYGNIVWLADGSIMLASEYDLLQRANRAPPLLGKIPGDAQDKIEKFAAARRAVKEGTTPKPTQTAPTGTPGTTTQPGTTPTGAPSPAPAPATTETTTTTAPVELPPVPPGVGFDEQSIKTARSDNPGAIGGGPGAQTALEATKKYDAESRANAAGARDASRYVQELVQNLSNVAQKQGLDTPGFAFKQRAAITSLANTLSRAVGGPEFGEGDSFNQISEKISTMLAAAQAAGGNQEAYAALTLLKSAVANPDMSPRAFSKLAADIMVQNQRAIDRDAHRQVYSTVSNGPLSKAASDFERANKAEKYNKEAKAIQDMLLKAPDLIADFKAGKYSADDINASMKKKYGVDGMSRYFLGGI